MFDFTAPRREAIARRQAGWLGQIIIYGPDASIDDSFGDHSVSEGGMQSRVR